MKYSSEFTTSVRDPRIRMSRCGQGTRLLSFTLILFASLIGGNAFAIDAGQILVADQGSNSVVQIDPVTGDQLVIASGAPFVNLSGITFDARRRVIYVSDRGDGAGVAAAIFRVDPETGDVTIIAEGGNLVEPAALLVESSRTTLLVADGIPGSLIRVNLFTGEQTVMAAATAASGLLFAGGTNYFVSHTSSVAIQNYDLNDPLNPIVVGAAGDLQAPTGIGGPVGGLHYVAENAGGKLIEINLAGYNPSFPDANQTVVADGGDVSSPYSVIRENSDSLLITDPGALAGAGAVIRYTPATTIEEIVATGGSISNPRGIAIVGDQIGSILRPDLVLTNPDTATISILNLNAMTLTTLKTGSPLISPTGVAVDPSDQSVLVADADGGLASSGAVFEIDEAGGVTIISTGGSLQDPIDIEVERDGSLVVADSGAGAVFRINRSNGTQTQLAALNGAAAVTVAADGSIYAAGTSPNQVVRIPPGGGGFTIVAADGNLAGPTGLVVDPDGMIAVLDAARVIRIDPDNYDPGNKTANQTVLVDDGVPVSPTAIESDEESHYMLADPAADGAMGDLVKVFNAGGGQLFALDAALGNVTGLALKRRLPKAGEIIIAALNLKRLVRVDPDTGEQIAVSTLGWLDKTNGVAIRDERSAFVVTARGSILLVDLATGQQTLLHTASGDPSANETVLQDVAVDGDGNGWVIDEQDGDGSDGIFNGRIFRIDGQTHEVTQHISDPLLLLGKGIDVDPDGILWVATNLSGTGVNVDKILKYDPNGVEGVVQVASGSPLVQPGDVVFMPSGPFAGSLFVPDVANLIQVEPSDGTLTIVDSGGFQVGSFNATVDNDMNILTADRFSPYNLVRHAFTSDGGATPASVEQTVLSRGLNITTSTGLDVMPIPEPSALSAGFAALLTLATIACWRTRKTSPQAVHRQ